MLAQKESVMQRNYVKEHYDDLMSDVENPMIISYLELSVSDVSALSDEEQQKVDAINKALEEGTSFAEVAGEYNESVYSTTNGFDGYIDENTASWISSASDVIPLDEKRAERGAGTERRRDEASGSRSTTRARAAAPLPARHLPETRWCSFM